MSLIKSISGIRGTIGGTPGEALTAQDIVKFTAAFAQFITANRCANRRVVVGRDARVSGQMVHNLVVGTLLSMGADVIDIGMATTPTTELAVEAEKAAGGIIITASHNPKNWNALKLLNSEGQFLSAADGQKVLEIAEKGDFSFADVELIKPVVTKDYAQYHIDRVLGLFLVDVEAVRAAHFRVAVDTINSVGALILPMMLERLGVECVLLNGTPDGNFAHNPEPLEQNLEGIMATVAGGGFSAGFVVDPDVDRLAIIDERGAMFGEEYTLVACADYVLANTPDEDLSGYRRATVSNLSSSRALADVTKERGGTYQAAAVGEVNVVTKMRETRALIGGEGNGGVIYPLCHPGRDALVGIALFLSLMAKTGKTPSQLRSGYPAYHISKNRIDLKPDTNIDAILNAVKSKYRSGEGEGAAKVLAVTDIDGVKIDFRDSWVHLRRSNTEPIIRIYAEAHSATEADALAQQIKNVMGALL